jgi:arylformamidase
VAAEWIDVTVPLRSGMVHWPGDPEVRISRTLDLDAGDPCIVSHLDMSVHTATHVDAPMHYLPRGAPLDRMAPEVGIGRARVVEVRASREVAADELRHLRLRRGERVLLKSANSARCWKSETFVADYVHLGVDAARFVAERGVRLLGIDYLSVGGPGQAGDEVHRILLRAGVWIVEGLDLSHVRAGAYDLICLPLRLAGGEGAPARVLLRPRHPAGPPGRRRS